MKQAAIYVRAATIQQNKNSSLENQKLLLLQLAKKHGYEIPPDFIFEDIGSGMVLERSSLGKLRSMASKQLVECIFVMSEAHLSRKCAYFLLLMDEFKKMDIQVYFKNHENNICTAEVQA